MVGLLRLRTLRVEHDGSPIGQLGNVAGIASVLAEEVAADPQLSREGPFYYSTSLFPACPLAIIGTLILSLNGIRFAGVGDDS